MTGIDRIGGPAAPRPGTSSRAAGGPAFRMPDAGEAAAASAPAAPVGLAALLALQDEQERPRDRAARRHARDLLEELAALHAALLGAPGEFDGLSRLAALIATMPEPADHPVLRDAVADIRLRARIELARYAPSGIATAR